MFWALRTIAVNLLRTRRNKRIAVALAVIATLGFFTIGRAGVKTATNAAPVMSIPSGAFDALGTEEEVRTCATGETLESLSIRARGSAVAPVSVTSPDGETVALTTPEALMRFVGFVQETKFAEHESYLPGSCVDWAHGIYGRSAWVIAAPVFGSCWIAGGNITDGGGFQFFDAGDDMPACDAPSGAGTAMATGVAKMLPCIEARETGSACQL